MCLLSAFGGEDREAENEHVRAMTGALILADALKDLERIRLLLTPAKE